MELKPEEIVVGGVYRGRKPVKLQGAFRDVWNDRTVVWMNEKRSVVEYSFLKPTFGAEQKLCPITKFLEWVGRRLGPEEGSNVK